jgi:uncharacterized protein YecT (DUF1311 family)
MRRKTLATSSLFAVLSLVAFAARAEGECDRYKTAYDKTYCFSKLFVESDKELNEVYGKLAGAIKPEVKAELRKTQLAWIQHRDATCSQAGTINVDCNYRVNRERAEYLRDRLRECTAGNCRDDAIAKPSWN